MAEIPVQRKSNLTWLWLLLALLLVGALIWWLVAADDDDVVTGPVGTEAATEPVGTDAGMAPVAGQAPAGEAAPAALTIANILASPDAFVGRDDFSGEVNVPEVPTDRGFWVEDGGQRLFALIVDFPREVPKDINAGQRLRIANGMVRDETFMSQVPGRPLDADTQRIIEEQGVYLVVDEDDIEILSRAG